MEKHNKRDCGGDKRLRIRYLQEDFWFMIGGITMHRARDRPI